MNYNNNLVILLILKKNAEMNLNILKKTIKM